MANPTRTERDLAAESSRQLARFVSGKRKAPLRVCIEPNGSSAETISVPISAFRMLADILAEMAKGNAVSLVPTQAELTTQQAADFLHVSRPFVIEQLEKGAIPFRKVGSHRRVLLHDVMAYKRAMDQNRLHALDELSAVDQELGLGY